MILKKIKNYIGIELSENLLRAVFLVENNRGCYRMMDGIEMPLPEINQNTLKKFSGLTPSWPIKKAHITLGLPNSKAVIKELQLDKRLQDKEIMRYLQVMSSELFGVSFKELFFDYAQFNAENDKLRNIIQAIAVRKKNVNDIMSLFLRVKLSINTIELSIFGLERALRFSHPEIKHKKIAVIMTEGLCLMLCILQDTRLLYTKYEDYYSHNNSMTVLTAFNRVMQYYRSMHDEKIDYFILLGEKAEQKTLPTNTSPESEEQWLTLQTDIPFHLMTSYGLALRGTSYAH